MILLFVLKYQYMYISLLLVIYLLDHAVKKMLESLNIWKMIECEAWKDGEIPLAMTRAFQYRTVQNVNLNDHGW